MSSSVFYNHGSSTRFRKRKARFSNSEVHILLSEVRKNRKVVVGKFNRGVPSDVKKHTWAEITARINEIGECRREVIEVVKKWSDLKCDTKRKLDAMQAGVAPNRGVNSRFSRDLNQMEKIVQSILEMRDEDHSSGDLGPIEDDDDLLEEEEEMEEEDMIGQQSLANAEGEGRLSSVFPRVPERTAASPRRDGSRDGTTNMEGNEDEKIYDAPKKTHKSNVWRYFGFFKRDGELDKTHVICKQCRVAIKYAGNTTNLATHMKRRHGVDTSAAPPSSPSGSTGAPDTPSGSRAGDKNNADAAFGDSDEDQKVDVLPYTHSVTENHKNNGVLKPGPPQTSSRPSLSSSQNAREAMLQNASLSVEEQHTTNILLETVSRSLELLSESVQQLAETQQEFVRESLQLQRETVQVLRDFTGGAIALMHDKLNGRPAL